MAISIKFSVGLNATNQSGDVTTIQKALNDISPMQGGASPKLKVDGLCGPVTQGAIKKFQTVHPGLTPDSKVDPNGATLKVMNSILDPSSADHDPKALALDAVPTALMWAAAAQAALALPALTDLQSTALETHFHISKGKLPRSVYLSIIRGNYAKVIQTLNRAAVFFRGRTDAEAKSDRGVDSDGVPFPAYTFFQGSINFTTSFHPWTGSDGFGPKCRAAMVLHEPVHFVDQLANTANDIYEHNPRYDTCPPETSVHSPSSYVCFAEHLVFGSDVRFGAGRPSE